MVPVLAAAAFATAAPCHAQGALVGPSSSGAVYNSAAKYYTQFANGYWWTVYDDGSTGQVLSSSPDGVTWTSQGSIFTFNPNSAANHPAVRFSGTTIIAATYRGSDTHVYYRSGTLNSNGTVTWASAQQDIGAEANYPALNANIVNGKPVMWRSNNVAGGAGAIWRGSAIPSPTTWTKTAADAPVMSATTIGVYTAGAIYPTGGTNPDDLIVIRATTTGNAPPGPAPGEHQLVSIKWNATLDAYDASWYNVSTLGGTLTEDTSTEVRTGSDGVYQKKFAAVRDTSGNLHVFYVNQNTRLSHYRKAPGFNDTWTRLTADLTGFAAAKVAVTALPNNNLILFYDHNDSRLYYRQYDGTSWGSETMLQDLNDATTDLNDALAPPESATDCSIGLGYGEGLGPTFNVRFTLGTGCPNFQTTAGAGTVTVSDPGNFQATFDTTFGGGIHTFYDLGDDPGRATDLGGGPDTSGVKVLHHFGILSGGSFYDPDDNTSDTASPRWVGSPPKVDLLEATQTRVRVRQEAFFQQSGGTSVLPLKGYGDYSLYSGGRIALRWNRRATGSVAFTDQDLALGVLSECPPLPACTNLTAYAQSGSIPAGGNLATPLDDFLLLQRSQVGRRADFLNIQYVDWTLANRVEFDNTVAFATWRDNPVTGSPLTAGTSTVWNFLTYFKPINFASNADAAVTGRSADYRGPDTLTVTVGTGWTDGAENTAGADLFNESEALYTLQMSPVSGLSFDISAGATPRFKPFFKIRQWRSLGAPSTVTLEGTTLLKDVNYRADVKPVPRAFFKSQVRFYSTLQSAAVVTTPDIGTAGTVNGSPTFVSARHGFGVNIANSTQYVAFTTAGGFIGPRGAVEFWYQPTYAHNDGVLHDICGFVNGGDKFVVEKRADNGLYFQILASGNNSELQVTSANYSWRAGDWVHIRITWDDAIAPIAQQQHLYLNGFEPPHNGPTVDYANTNLSAAAEFRFGNTNGDATFAPGIYDEIYAYDGASDGLIAYAGLTANANEYLADPTRNAPLPFTAIDSTSTNRGSYLYFGADSKFRGLNIALATAGAGVAAGDIDWQAWDGSAWANIESLGGFGDTTNSFTKSGNLFWQSGPPLWALYSLGGGPELYYVRARLKAGAAYTTVPVEALIKTDILLFQYCGDITAAAQTFTFAAPVTTAVTLQSFTAQGSSDGVVLDWSTASEIDNLGFHLYRSLAEGGPYERITASVIPGLGAFVAGRSYSYVDKTTALGVRYFYQLEDIDTSGHTERHGPVSAVAGSPASGSSAPMDGSGSTDASGSDGSGNGWGSSPSSSSRVAYGAPGAASIRILSRTDSEAVLELTTPGFYASPEANGAVRLEIPGFEVSARPGAPAVPIRRAWLEAVAGRRVEIAAVSEADVVAFPGLRPSATPANDVAVGRSGTVRATTAPRAESSAFASASPRASARLQSVGFQRERKKALLELAPLRWDGATGQLVLARRLRIHVLFTGAATDEVALGGSRGRRVRDRESFRARNVVARLFARAPGLHSVRFEDVFASGRRAVPAAALRLSRLGQAVAYHLEPDAAFFGPGSSLFFLSEGASLNPDGDAAVYELETGSAGRTMPVSSALAFGPEAAHAWAEARFEQNRYYQAALLEAPDLWLWDTLVSPNSKSYPFALEAPAPSAESARLRVWLQGISDFEANPDHHVRAHVNGFFVAEAFWDGKRPLTLEGQLPADLLQASGNVLQLENVGDTGAAYSMVFLNRFEIRYPRALAAAEGVLDASFSVNGRASVAGLSAGAFLLDTSSTTLPRWMRGASAGPAGLSFAVQDGHRYLAVGPEKVLRPEIRKLVRSSLRSRRNAAEYLLVAPQAFLEAAQPLLELRRSQGLAARAVSLEEIVNTFGHGETHAEAVKEFLEFAFQRWHRPTLRYVLLLGDATYDPKNYLGTGVTTKVPALTVKTSYLWTASDPSFALVNGDDQLPDLAIGRLPAATVDEARTMIDKIVAFEAEGPGFRGPALFVADNADLAGNFEQDADDAASLFGESAVEKVYLRDFGGASRPAIQQALDRGPSFVSYVGHGGTAVWASENIWNNLDVNTLAYGTRPHLLLTMNCLNGFFHFPSLNSLAEQFLKADGKGAVAAFSPSGLSVNEPAHLLHKMLLAEVLSGRHARLGDAVLAAQASYTDSGAFPELLNIYNLLGDPALRLR
jgi:hypothetical protein